MAPNGETALAAAFRRAGVKTGDARLAVLAGTTLRGFRMAVAPAGQRFAAEVYNDDELLAALIRWQITEQNCAKLATAYLELVAADMRGAGGGGSHSNDDPQSGYAPATTGTRISREADADGSGQDDSDHHVEAAHPSAPHHQEPPALAAGGGRRRCEGEDLTSQPRVAPAGNTPHHHEIGRKTDADGSGHIGLDYQSGIAHPSAPHHPETPVATQRQVQPAGQHHDDLQAVGAGGHPIPETSRESAAGGGQKRIDPHVRYVSPSTLPASDGGGRGHGSFEIHAEVAASNLPAPVGGAGQSTSEPQFTSARPNKPSPSPGHAKRGLSAMASVQGTVARSLLDTFIVNGRPVGDVTVEEADRWAAARERDGRFVKLLIHGLPHGSVIRTHITESDAQRIWTLAQNRNPAVTAPTIDAKHPADYREVPTNA